jgi:hypothetical protein
MHFLVCFSVSVHFLIRGVGIAYSVHWLGYGPPLTLSWLAQESFIQKCDSLPKHSTRLYRLYLQIIVLRFNLQKSYVAFRNSPYTAPRPSGNFFTTRVLRVACSLVLAAAVSNFPWDSPWLGTASPLLRRQGKHCYMSAGPTLPYNTSNCVLLISVLFDDAESSSDYITPRAVGWLWMIICKISQGSAEANFRVLP